jgi:5-methylcytosine-specific restriction endonuclease McrA
MSEAWEKGSTRRWRRVRALVLARDAHTCRARVPGTCVGRSTPMHVHHIHGKSRCAGCRADHPDHLIAACEPCNLRIGDPGRDQEPKPRPVTRWV